MQEYAFLPEIGADARAFWAESNALARRTQADPLITYMHLMYRKAKAKGVRIDRKDLVAQGRRVKFYPGVEQWFDANEIRPRVVGEFADTALLLLFGQGGEGLFCAPTVVASEMRQRYLVRTLGQLDGVRERIYAISAERKLKNPAIVAISEMARRKLFGSRKKSK